MRPAAILGLVFAGAATIAAQEHDQHAGHGRFGTVAFANSCAADVQPAFARGMALLHSFEFGPAIDAFREVAAKDSSCGIALWGAGMSQWGNPFAATIRSAEQLRTGRETTARATAVGAKTARERQFIAALTTLYAAPDGTDQHARVAAYRDAMGKLSAAYPDDSEAAAFYALSLAGAASPSDKTYADQLKAGAILERLWKAQPEHPGLAHYIIHSYDAPPLASRAVAAARRYASIAPDAPHALHMPSHTFTRLGYWEDSIATNILSANAARKAGQIYEELHASDYEVYAYLQTGQDAKARQIVDAAPGIAARVNASAGAAPAPAGSYAVAAIPARYALERGAWTDAARLEVRPSTIPYAEAITWFARALGSARSGNPAQARKDTAMLAAAAEKLGRSKDAYWQNQVDIQRRVAEAWAAFAEGKHESALAAMQEAAAMEDRTEKAAVTPGPLAPARELLAEMLLEMKMPKEALANFRKTMDKEPNRFRAVYGAAIAAERSGDSAAAREYFGRLLTIAAKGDTPGRPELQTARREAAKKGS